MSVSRFTSRFYVSGVLFGVCKARAVLCAFHFSYLRDGGREGDKLDDAFAVIISICSHLKRLANTRSHASSALRIICVCFLTPRRDCVNLLRGEKIERWGKLEKNKKKDRRSDRCFARRFKEIKGSLKGGARR